MHDQFYDVRDAVASARAAKRNQFSSTVVFTDLRTGKLVIEVEDTGGATEDGLNFPTGTRRAGTRRA
jgi:hypothetical protein